MKLQDKYAKISDKEDNKINKVVISDDTFAICDSIERLIIKLEKIRFHDK